MARYRFEVLVPVEVSVEGTSQELAQEMIDRLDGTPLVIDLEDNPAYGVELTAVLDTRDAKFLREED